MRSLCLRGGRLHALLVKYLSNLLFGRSRLAGLAQCGVCGEFRHQLDELFGFALAHLFKDPAQGRMHLFVALFAYFPARLREGDQNVASILMVDVSGDKTLFSKEESTALMRAELLPRPEASSEGVIVPL
jgi:hypothetical protein